MRFVPLLLCAFAIMLAASLASAADDPRKASADALYAEGKALHEQRRFPEALAKFEASYEVYPSPNTLAAIAREEQLLERNVTAIRHLREALSQPLFSPNNVPAAKARLAELERLVGRLDVRGPVGTRVIVGDVEARLPLEAPIDVEPGAVSVLGELDGRRSVASASAVAGRVVTVTLGSIALPPADAPPPEPERSWWSTRRTIGAASGGLALLAAGAGVGFAIVSEDHVSELNRIDSQTPQPCADPSGPTCAAYDAARSGATSARTGELVSFIAGGALLTTGGLLLLWPEGRTEQARLRAVPTLGGLSLTSTF